jgi:hypothetical protein
MSDRIPPHGGEADRCQYHTLCAICIIPGQGQRWP